MQSQTKRDLVFVCRYPGKCHGLRPLHTTEVPLVNHKFVVNRAECSLGNTVMTNLNQKDVKLRRCREYLMKVHCQ